jgi:hypothetical protein
MLRTLYFACYEGVWTKCRGLRRAFARAGKMSLRRGREDRGRTVPGHRWGRGGERLAKMTVEVAARSLGIKEESVRKRVRRGTIRSEKDADGRLYVYVDSAETVRDGYRDEPQNPYAYRSVDEPAEATREIIEAKNETIRILHHQLQEERDARRRTETVIAQLMQVNAAIVARVPELKVLPTESSGIEVRAVTTAEEVRRSSEPSSWWRRLLGGE